MNRFFVLLALVAAFAVTAGAQVSGFDQLAAEGAYLEQFRDVPADKVVGKVWLDICVMNRAQYPDSNLVQPGDVIRLPLGRPYVAKRERGTDHMWQASLYFVNEVVAPYLIGERSLIPLEGAVQSNTSRPLVDSWDDRALLIIFFLAVVLLAAWMLYRANRIGERPKAATPPPPFVATPLDFQSAADTQVRPVATEALGRTFGRNFEIIGEIVRGWINGRLTVFFADGSRRTEEYENEEGFQARLHFSDGTERTVVSRWQCFNPVWSASDVEFRGTFTPAESGKPEEIPQISESQVAHLSQNIQDLAAGREPVAPVAAVVPESFPATPPSISPSTATSASEETKRDGEIMRLTKLQFSTDKGLNLEGNIPLTVEELKELISKVSGTQEQKQK